MANPKIKSFLATTIQGLGIFRLSLAAVLAALYLMNQQLAPEDSALAAAFYIIFTLYLVFLLLSYYLLKREKLQTTRVIRLFALIDLAYLSILCFLTGGSESPLIIMMLLSIMAHGSFLPIWQALVIVLLAILFQGYFIIMGDGSLRHPELVDYLRDGDVIRLITQGIIAVVAVIITNIWLQKYEASEQVIAKQKEELKTAIALHEIIVQQAVNGIIVIDEYENILLINDYIHTWFGGKTITGMPLKRYLPSLYDRYLLWEQLGFDNKRALKHQENDFYLEFKKITTNKNIYTLINIEETTTANQRAQQNKLASLGQLTAAIAHELRNPMTSVYQAAQLLNENREDLGPKMKLLDMIQNNIDRANRIISEILSVARKEEPQIEKIEVRPWANDFFQEFTLNHPELDNQVTISIDKNLHHVFFDLNHLQQVVTNLMHNAIVHSERPLNELTITLIFTTIAGNPTLTIYDNGVGIPLKDRSFLFEPFFTTSTKGTGLGLFLVKEICGINGAQIDYVSGKVFGSGFRLIFPALYK